MALPAALQIGLKEWASVCDALGVGRQIILLRKGGIYEAAGEFELENSQFVLFPTYLHQNVSMLKAEAHAGFVAAAAEPGEVRICVAAEVGRIMRLRDRAQMDALFNEHLWAPALIDMRFGYKPQNPLYLLTIRAYLLQHPAMIQNTPDYAGCKSWVPLDRAIDAGGAAPVLDDRQFEARTNKIFSAIGEG